MAGLEKQGRPWNDPTLIDDDLRAYRNMLCATPGATARKRSVEISRGVWLCVTLCRDCLAPLGGQFIAKGCALEGKGRGKGRRVDGGRCHRCR